MKNAKRKTQVHKWIAHFLNNEKTDTTTSLVPDVLELQKQTDIIKICTNDVCYYSCCIILHR